MKSVIIASLIASAAAFAPAQQKSTSSTSLAAFEDELGVQAPIGFWDPLGMVDGVNQERFDQLRYTEIKHGRVAMLAFLGFVTQEAGIRIGGDIDFSGTSFASIPSGAGAITAMPKGGLFQIFAFVLVLEFIMRDNSGDGEFIGDFRSGTIDFGWDTFDEDEKMSKRAIELNNGRAAQMGILGLMIHEQLGNLGTVIPGL